MVSRWSSCSSSEIVGVQSQCLRTWQQLRYSILIYSTACLSRYIAQNIIYWRWSSKTFVIAPDGWSRLQTLDVPKLVFCVLRLGSRMEVRETHMISHVLGCFRQLGICNKVFPLLSAPCTSGQAEFTDLVGENSPFLSALLKVYKKKVGWSKLRRMLSWASVRLKMGYWCTMVHPWIWGYTHFQSFPGIPSCGPIFRSVLETSHRPKVKRSKRKKGGEEEDFDEDEEDEDDEAGLAVKGILKLVDFIICLYY